ncbi:MAG: hypothetical protein MO852_02690 [Candidatus Devosia euplotis]|nr:hypothetical protein [Candidatus Devosia euplotis]
MTQFRFAAFAAPALFTSLPGTAAQADTKVDAKASYALTLGGINIASINVDLKDDGARYTLDLSANVAGMGGALWPAARPGPAPRAPRRATAWPPTPSACKRAPGATASMSMSPLPATMLARSKSNRPHYRQL